MKKRIADSNGGYSVDMNEKEAKKTTSDRKKALLNYKKNKYKEDRSQAYGPIEDQLDMMYHDFEGWRAHAESVKLKFPKGK